MELFVADWSQPRRRRYSRSTRKNTFKTKTRGDDMTPQTQTQLVVPVNAQDHSRGPKNAPITLVEYGDFECPHCGQAHYQLQELEKAIGESMRLVFREFPLSTVHPH